MYDETRSLESLMQRSTSMRIALVFLLADWYSMRTVRRTNAARRHAAPMPTASYAWKEPAAAWESLAGGTESAPAAVAKTAQGVLAKRRSSAPTRRNPATRIRSAQALVFGVLRIPELNIETLPRFQIVDRIWVPTSS